MPPASLDYKAPVICGPDLASGVLLVLCDEILGTLFTLLLQVLLVV